MVLEHWVLLTLWRDMVNDDHKDFIKAIISMEKGINDESALDKLYDA